MNYIIYTTEGYTELPVGNPVENCQIIDFVEGTTESVDELKDEYARRFGLRVEDIRIVPTKG